MGGIDPNQDKEACDAWRRHFEDSKQEVGGGDDTKLCDRAWQRRRGKCGGSIRTGSPKLFSEEATSGGTSGYNG
jgi:hypothetical protein